VTQSQEQGAWLMMAEGKVHRIHGSCSLGRGLRNTIVLQSSKVSRRHALIHLQNIGEFWLIDFGSSNGTFLNKRRILHPVRLRDGDQITVGDRQFEFHQPEEISQEYRTLVTQRTLHEIKKTCCWLLVADIENFTPMSRTLEAEVLETLLGEWIAECKDIIENHDGLINKYLGDGFLAYWREEEANPEEIASVLSALKEVQSKNSPRFRIVLHLGGVAIGGVATMGEESLLGKEVNLVFRLENLARALGELCGLSEPAHKELGKLVPVRYLGEHELKGFRAPRVFFGAL
jgi:adenylate cyclase